MDFQFISRLFSVKSAAGVEITTLDDGSYLINIVIAGIKKEKISIVKKIYALKDIQQIKEHIPAGTPIALVLNGKGVLHKSIGSTEKTVLNSLIPGVKSTDFYVQDFELLSFKDVCITRKGFVDEMLNAFEISGLKVLDIYLGFSSLHTILPIIQDDTLIETTQYHIQVNKGVILSYSKISSKSEKEIVKPEINIATEYVNENMVIPFSAAVAILSGAQMHDENSVPLKVLESTRRAIEDKRIQLYSWIFLCATLLILLANSLVFSHYYKKNEDITSVYQSGLLQSEKNDSAVAILKRKKIFLDDIGWADNNRKLSFYADRIAAAMPYEITLTSMNLFPIQSRQSFVQEGISFMKQDIAINGECDDPSVLYDWLGRMQLISGINNAKVNNYYFNKETQTGSFVIELILK